MSTVAVPMTSAPPGRRQAVMERIMAAGFALPALLLLLLTILVPLGVLAYLSFTDYELGAVDVNYVGLSNITSALSDPNFRRALTNTLIYVAIVLPGSVILSLLVAVLVHRRKRTRSLYEIIYFLPVTSTFIAMATVWQFVLHPSLGPISAALRWLGIGEIAFLSDPALALPTLAVIGIWQLIGFNMVLFLAGLSTIPKDLYEAAEIDGCGGEIDRFMTITWPLLGPTTMFVIVTSSITAFKVFDTVAVLTHGGPGGSTEVLLYDIYLEGFQYFRMAYAAVLTFIFLIFILVFSIFQTVVMDRKVHY
jgi:multiple sugar transport system permease protein